MAAASSLFPWRAPASEVEQRILLENVPWATYVMLRDTLDSGALHMTYLEGRLELMVTSRAHEVTKTQIARLLELFCLERDIPLYGYGGMTFRDEQQERGLEPDECYCRGTDRELADIALEVVVSNPLVDKLEVYRGLGVREVWVYLHEDAKFRLFALRGSAYEVIPSSEVLPELDLAQLVPYLLEPDQHVALRSFRDHLRAR